MQTREATYIPVIGAPGEGKSEWLRRKLLNGIRKNVLVYKSFLTIDDKPFKDYKYIKKLSDYRGGKAKISDIDIEYKDFLRMLTGSKENRFKDGFKNAAIVVDDAKEFEGHMITPEFALLVRIRRHLGLDIYYVYHGLTDIPIEHFKFTSSVVLFHTTDNADYKINKLPGGGAKLLAARDALAIMREKGIKYQPIIIKLA